MNEKQQKLYDKLLKKVNEYCLGAAAEDVIAAIDALVENYERYFHPNKNHLSIVKLIGKPTLEDALKTIYNSQDIMGGYDDFWEAYRMIETALNDAEKYKKAVKTIVKKDVDLEYEIFKTKNYTDYLKKWKDYLLECEILTQEEYEIIKEVSKRERTN